MHRMMLAVFVALGLACAGPKGDPGPEGPPGPQGPLGPAGTFTGSFAGNATIAGDINVQGRVVLPLGEGPNTAATSCAALLAARPGIPSGVYWLKPATAGDAFRAYCDMTNEGGGWTLVWSNLRGGRGKPFTELQYKAAINTLPRSVGEMGADLEAFMVYTGLKHWASLGPGGLLRYDWSTDYGSPVSQRYVCPYVFSNLSTYQITFNTPNCTQPIGTVAPSLVASHNNARFSAYDVDNDTNGTANCAATYGSSPWWYLNCWDGSLVGGGEGSGGNYFNGAYWINTAQAWATTGSANGAGNGWIFVK